MTTTATETTPAPAWADPTHEAWLGLSARFGRFVGTVADRTDLIARVAPDEHEGRPIACFVPKLAEVHFTANKIWDRDVDPETVDPNDALDRARHPQMVGAACHEAAHAAHTRLAIPKGTDRATAHWAVLLEEPRIEATLVARRPTDRVWLRAAAIQLCADGALALDTEGEGATRYQAGRSAVLFLGRVAAGVLTEIETAGLRDEIVDVLGDEAMAEVDAVLAETVAAADGDTATLLALGARMAAVVTEDTPEQPQQQPEDGGDQSEDGDGGQAQPGGSGSSGEDDSDEADQKDGSGAGSGESDEDGDPTDGTSSGAGSGANDDTRDADQGDGPGSGDGTESGEDEPTAHQMPCGSWTEGDLPEGVDPWSAPEGDGGGDTPTLIDAIRATAEQVASDADRKAKVAAFTAPPRDPGKPIEDQDAQITAAVYAATFGRQAAPIHVYERTPDAALTEQARRLTWALRRAQFRAVARTTTPALAPPGRMRMGEVMRRDAQKATRARITAQPWRQTRRREVTQPPLTVGFSGDVSGSMQRWQKVTADLSWAVAQATSHMAGRTAAVAWNQAVAPVVRPGENPPNVREAGCGGGSGGCSLSLRALDGALRLTADRDGARAVVVVTDGALGDTYGAINAEVLRLTRAGVKVLWVTPTPDLRIHVSATNVVLHDPTEFGETIGKALANLLASA